MLLRLLLGGKHPKGEHSDPLWGDRCTICGHRVGENVRATREQPFRTWPGELIGRVRARYQGRAIPAASYSA